jgi:hypothetical protein
MCKTIWEAWWGAAELGWHFGGHKGCEQRSKHWCTIAQTPCSAWAWCRGGVGCQVPIHAPRVAEWDGGLQDALAAPQAVLKGCEVLLHSDRSGRAHAAGADDLGQHLRVRVTSVCKRESECVCVCMSRVCVCVCVCV